MKSQLWITQSADRSRHTKRDRAVARPRFVVAVAGVLVQRQVPCAVRAAGSVISAACMSRFACPRAPRPSGWRPGCGTRPDGRCSRSWRRSKGSASPSTTYSSGRVRGWPDLAPVVVSSITGAGYTLLTLPPLSRSSGGSSRGATFFRYQFPDGDRANSPTSLVDGQMATRLAHSRLPCQPVNPPARPKARQPPRR